MKPASKTVPAARKVWVAPIVVALPKLTDLTLQTGGGIPGDCDPGDPNSCF